MLSGRIRSLVEHLRRLPRPRRTFRAWKQENPRGKYGEHRYAAEDFGTTEEAINDRFAAYISHFCVPRE